MAEKKKTEKEAEAGAIGRLSKVGEDALTRLVEELGKNERVTDAAGRAMSAKERIDDASKRAVVRVGLATAEELKDLRKHVERLEKRLAKLESGAKTPTARTTTRAKKTTDKAASPAPGRAVGGGTGRGSGSGGTAAR
jgi:hypothetical protein